MMTPMNALLLQPTEEVAILVVPDAWGIVPPEWLFGMLYWTLMRAVLAQPKALPVGPPRDIAWTVTSDAEELEILNPRHDCDSCRKSIRDAAAALKDGTHKRLAVCQFTLDYLKTPQQIAQEQK